MAKEDQVIAVVPRGILEENLFNRFQDANIYNFEKDILNNLIYKKRGLVDPNGDFQGDSNFKQPIGYGVLVNPWNKEVYAYQRTSDENSDPNLQGKWSWGIGGHIEKSLDLGNPIVTSLERELSEEVSLNGKITNVQAIGYVNDDSNEVGKLHLGILYILETNSIYAEPKGDEVAQGKFIKLRNLIDLVNVETWSQIALAPLERRY